MERDEFLIEQYKIIRTLTSRHDEKYYKILIINITAFGVIFGFSDKVDVSLVPFLLLSILLICFHSCKISRILGNSGSAFLIERYGAMFSYEDYESGSDYFSEKDKTSRSNLMNLVFLPMSVSRNSFAILCTLSFVGGIVISHSFLERLWNSNIWYLSMVYVMLLILGHLEVIVGLFEIKKKNKKYFRHQWRRYLDEHAPNISIRETSARIPDPRLEV